MKNLFKSILIILFFLIAPLFSWATELCDCYGSCVIKHPREVSTEFKRVIKLRDGYSAYDKVDIDHIIPLSIGGCNSANNLQALSKERHKIKTQHDMLLLYYVKNCLMTIEEAQSAAKNYKDY